MNTTTKLSPADLRQFTGTENYYRHALNRHILFTDGCKYVADEGGAYWLLDLIACAQRYEKHLARQPFQVWALAVHLPSPPASRVSVKNLVELSEPIRGLLSDKEIDDVFSLNPSISRPVDLA